MRSCLSSKLAFMLVVSSTLFANAGCRSTEPFSDPKDVVSTGESVTGKSVIALSIYPIGPANSNQIQMQRCVTLKSDGSTQCAYTCADRDQLQRALTSKLDDGTEARRIIAAIDNIRKEQIDQDFKAIQSVMLTTGIGTECSQTSSFHPIKSITKQTSQARRDSGREIATAYTLLEDGTFFRIINGIRCTVTTRVQDFKISEHLNDTGLVYFIKASQGQDSMWQVQQSAEPGEGQCPKTVAFKLLDNIEKKGEKFSYYITSNTHTSIVKAALTADGNFVAYDNIGPVLQSNPAGVKITDVSMNECFGVDGKSFKTYVMFLHDANDRIHKIKGDEPGEFKTDPGTYASIAKFKEANNVCEENK